MRFVAMVFTSLIDFAAIASMPGCAPATTQAQACPPGTPWVPADYANGKWVNRRDSHGVDLASLRVSDGRDGDRLPWTTDDARQRRCGPCAAHRVVS